MFKNKLFLFVFVAGCQLFTVNFYAQVDLESKDYYTWFDSVVGNGNSGIYNGTLFEEKYITKPNNHRFFTENSYFKGHLIYDHQTYYNVDLKYDIHKDELIAKLPNQSNFLFIKLIKEKVQVFDIITKDMSGSEIKNSFFNSKTKTLIKNPSFNGFYQQLYTTNSLQLLKKNHKIKSDFIDNDLVFTKFTDVSFYALIKNNAYYQITSKKDIIKVFPKQKRSISIFYRKNRKLFKLNEDVFYINLLKDIELSMAKSVIK